MDEQVMSNEGDGNNESTMSVTETVGLVDDWVVGEMKMKTVDGHRVAVVNTASGFHAVDNACPHQGYGLTTGSLDGELVTCQWHNWKFDVRTGRCVMGEEDVACHPVDVADGEVRVTVTRPSIEEERQRLWPSLARGIDADYRGQIARDSVRLLQTGVEPSAIMSAGLQQTTPKTEYGIGHGLAMAADCLAMAEIRNGTDQALPLAQGLSALSEPTRDRPARPVPAPDPTVDVAAAIEAEDVKAAMAGVMGLIEDDRQDDLRHVLIDAASAHHLGYGHGMIYTQKSFEVLDRIGWDAAPGILPHLAASHVWNTREDTLPYMATTMKALATVDLGSLTEAEQAEGWQPDDLADRLLNAEEPPILVAADAVTSGAGIEGLIDAVAIGASQRLLRHDLQVEFDHDEPFGWLDITHALTTAQAARWAWRTDRGPHTARAALFATWLLFDSGRSERRHHRDRQGGDSVGIDHSFHPDSLDQPLVGDLATAVAMGDARSAVALATTGDRTEVGDALGEASLADNAGSFIVAAHLIKTAEAARREADELDSNLPLVAAARFLASPRLERFVARNVAEAVDFVTTGRPPRR
jgi:nitrite reductase/ring-hydroxylating ferredoxin subunit